VFDELGIQSREQATAKVLDAWLLGWAVLAVERYELQPATPPFLLPAIACVCGAMERTAMKRKRTQDRPHV